MGFGYDAFERSSTGTADSKTFCYGMPSTNCQISSDHNYPVKFFGIEGLWGTTYTWLDGLVAHSDDTLWAYFGRNTKERPNQTGTGYTEVGRQSSAGYIKQIVGNNNLGFFAADSTGSNSTYFCDLCAKGKLGEIFIVGRNILDPGANGIFYMSGPTEYATTAGTRLLKRGFISEGS